MSKKIVSYLVSGRGSNFRVIAENIMKGGMNAMNGAVISDKKDAPALDIARDLGIEVYSFDPSKFITREEYEKEIYKVMKTHSTDLIAAAGYMRIITPFLIKKFPNRIMNIHPALLPSFPGKDAQKHAIEYGVKVSGCTVHFVDEGTDTGPIILQKAVPVLDDDTESILSKRILQEEHLLYSEAVKLFCEDRLVVRGRSVYIKKKHRF